MLGGIALAPLDISPVLMSPDANLDSEDDRT
jgi:hypothetical protein